MGQIPAPKNFNAPTPYSQSPVNQVLQQAGPLAKAPRQQFMALNQGPDVSHFQAAPTAQNSQQSNFYGNTALARKLQMSQDY